LNRWPGLRVRLFRNLLPVVPTIFMSTVETRFNDSCAQGSFDVSLLLECLYSLEMEFLSSAPYRATLGSVT